MDPGACSSQFLAFPSLSDLVHYQTVSISISDHLKTVLEICPSGNLLTKPSAITAFALEKYSTHSSVVSAIINMWRTCGGFAVSYFQASWIQKDGVVAVFATQAAIVGVTAVLLVGTVIWMGRKEAERGLVVDIESEIPREQGVVWKVRKGQS